MASSRNVSVFGMKRLSWVAGSVASSTVFATAAFAQPPSTIPADTSRVNKADSDRNASDDAQANFSADLSLTQRIRASLVADKTLSAYARQVKIVAIDGTVTLLGAVRSSAERQSVQNKAVAVAGQDKVINKLTVAPPTS